MPALNGPALRFPTCKTENKAFQRAFPGQLLEPAEALGNGRRNIIRKSRDKKKAYAAESIKRLSEPGKIVLC